MKENKVHILVVEDEYSIRSFTRLNLEMAGYEVSEAESGEEALEKIKLKTPDLVILDIMLPGIDGLEVCKHIRNNIPDCFIIMLTAKSQDTDKIEGLEIGADDYMIKPFNPLELVARIKAMLRRRSKTQEDEEGYSFGIFYFDADNGRLFKNKAELELTPTELALLTFFLRNPEKTLKRDKILNEVWGYEYFGDTKTLDVHIRRLREKIETNPSQPKFIRTVWGTGYRWQNIGDEKDNEKY